VTRMMSGSTSHIPFWFKPVSTFGLLQLTTFIDSSHVLPVPTSLATEPQLCSEFLVTLAVSPSSKAVYIVLKASQNAITSAPSLSRLLHTEMQVPSLSIKLEQLLTRLRVAPS
jgi:hypothetical protein